MYDLAHRETLPQSIKRHNEEVAKVSVVDFTWHFILHNDPYIFALSLQDCLKRCRWG
jgi:hypothetical protein